MRYFLITRFSFLTLLLFAVGCVSNHSKLEETTAKNELLDRSFWKSSPSVEEVKLKAVNKEFLTEFTPFYFDAVTYALLEKAPFETIKYLLKIEGNAIDKVTHDGRNYLMWAAYAGYYEMVEYLIEKGSDVQWIDEHGYGLITFTAVGGNTDSSIYQLLVQHGASLEELNRSGANALHLLAPVAKNLDELSFFIDNGLSIAALDDEGNSLIHYAASKGNLGLIDELVQKGLQLDHKNEQGEDALFAVARGTRGHVNETDTYEFFVQNGLDANSINKSNESLFHAIASSVKDSSIYEYLYSNKAPFDLVSKDGWSVDALAVRYKNYELYEFLSKKGVSIDINDRTEKGVLFQSVSDYEESINSVIQDLIDRGANYTRRFTNGKTIFHLAVEQNSTDLLEMAIQWGVNINAKNSNGMTPLHIAVSTAKNDKMVNALLANGSDISVKTDFEESALDLLIENELLNQNEDIKARLKL